MRLTQLNYSVTFLQLALLAATGCGVGHEDRPFCTGRGDLLSTVGRTGEVTTTLEVIASAGGGTTEIFDTSFSASITVSDTSAGDVPHIQILDPTGQILLDALLSTEEPVTFSQEVEAERIPFSLSYRLQIKTDPISQGDVGLDIAVTAGFCQNRDNELIEPEILFQVCEGICD